MKNNPHKLALIETIKPLFTHLTAKAIETNTNIPHGFIARNIGKIWRSKTRLLITNLWRYKTEFNEINRLYALYTKGKKERVKAKKFNSSMDELLYQHKDNKFIEFHRANA